MSKNVAAEETIWQVPRLRYVGDVTELVRMPGNGKSGTGADPGDFLKPPGQDK